LKIRVFGPGDIVCEVLATRRRTRSSTRKREPAVSRVLSGAIIHLGQPSPTASSNLPGSPLGTGGADESAYSPIWSCSRRGLPCRGVLPPARCALTAPFHPCRRALRARFGGIFSVALSMDSRPPGVTWRLVRGSPDFPPAARFHDAASDCLADSHLLEPRMVPHSRFSTPCI
jgi:hypothetical protein